MSVDHLHRAGSNFIFTASEEMLNVGVFKIYELKNAILRVRQKSCNSL